MGKYLLLCCFFLLSIFSFSQEEKGKISWAFIDTSINNKRNLRDLRSYVQKAKADFINQKKYFHVARCYYYEIRIADQLTEDSLYFYNSRIIDSLLMTPGISRELQLSMLLLKTNRLIEYKSSYRSYNRKRYERNDLPVNYAALTDQQVDSTISRTFEDARQIAGSNHDITTEEVLWLSSDPLQFLFKPGLYDIVIAEEIRFNQKSTVYDFLLRSKHPEWNSISPDAFIARLDSVSTLDKKEYWTLNLYRDWIYHHKNEKEIYYFLETMARKYFAGRHDNLETNSNEYEKYLAAVAATKYRAAKAHVIYQLCLLWNYQAKKYSPYSTEEYSSNYNLRNQKEFDSTFRFHALKALQLFDQNRSLFDSFAYLKGILEKMETKIRRSESRIIMEGMNLPNEPLLATMTYKNTDTLFYKVVKVNHEFELPESQSKDRLKRLLRQQTVRQDNLMMPPQGDYNNHVTYLKFEPFPIGNYYLLFSHKPISDSNNAVEWLDFTVTSIAAITNNRRVYVLDRKNGRPIPGARIIGRYLKNINDTARVKPVIEKYYKTNELGYVNINDSKIYLLDVCYRGDTLSSNVEIDRDDERPEEVYDKEEYESLVEYYEENAEAYIYADRSIYRPGQTVYHKAILLTKDKKTGERMVMSPKNLGSRLFSRVYKKWVKEEEPYMSVLDPFGKEVDSTSIKLNEYGSFSGSFKIPKTAATGEWNIEPDYIEVGDIGDNNGMFRVEEYKRPSYEISIDKPKKQLLPGDSVVFLVKVKSFAGASLNNVLIKYSVNRSGEVPGDGKRRTEYSNEELLDTLGYTNEQGELAIVVVDSLIKLGQLDDQESWNFQYYLEVEAVDQTGESFTEEERLTVSSRPVRINFVGIGKIDRSKKMILSLGAKDINAGNVSKKISIKISRVESSANAHGGRKLFRADSWIYSKEELERLFPYVDFATVQATKARSTVLEKTIQTEAGEKIILEPSLFGVGEYVVEAVCEEKGRVIGKAERNFSVFDENESRLPGFDFSFFSMPINSFYPGDTLKVYSGNSEDSVYVIRHIKYLANGKKTKVVNVNESSFQKPGLNVWQTKIPANAVDRMIFVQTYIYNNQVYTNEQDVYIDNPVNSEPEIIVEKYRKKLAPGSKETFEVSIKTKNTNLAAELLTTMYDASLDKLEKHEWRVPQKERRYLNSSWSTVIGYTSNSYNGYSRTVDVDLRTALNLPLWWISSLDEDVMGDWSTSPHPTIRFGFRTNTIESSEFLVIGDLAKTVGVDEVVVVVGYGSQVSKNLMGISAGVTIRGTATLANYKGALIIIDGVPFEGDISKVDANSIVDAIILKGADAAAIYGSRAAEGVLILSTKGLVVLPNEQEPPLPPRKNFNETAFFFPVIHADKDGFYRFTFTMPESVTEWNWKMLVHTKNAEFATAGRKLNTQLPLMVQPNMPRLLYQGDRILLQSRISNLDTLDATGTLFCKIEDAVTGEDISGQFMPTSQQNFSIAKKSNQSQGFQLNVPAGQLNPIKVTISARTSSFSDGEEHIIPVLSTKSFVRQAQPFYFLEKDTAIQPIRLPADASLFGVGLAIRPKPQGALINSLPYLAEYSYDCAEQVTNKILALLTGVKIMQTDSLMQESFARMKQQVEQSEEKTQLPDELSEDAMPWLRLSNQTEKQQQKLFRLLDSTKTYDAVNTHLDKLYKLQNSDGGLSWFPGGNSDPYISQYVMGSFGQMSANGMLYRQNVFDKDFFKFIANLVSYCDKTIPDNKANYFKLEFIRARSYWREYVSIPANSKQKIDSILHKEWQAVERKSLAQQALLIISTLETNAPGTELGKKAIMQLNSIRQLAIEDEINGTRWKAVSDADDLAFCTEEALALVTEAFRIAGTDKEIGKGIIKWLFANRSEHHWGSTKATAAVVNLLNKEMKSVSGPSMEVNAGIGNEKMSVSNDLLNGSLYSFKEIKMIPGQINLSKQSLNASGDLVWYYFTSTPPAGLESNGVTVKKFLYRYNSSNNEWEPVTEGMVLSVADKLRVTLVIETTRPLRYVYIDDKRAGGLEPVVYNSGYEYDGFGYYRSVRDAGNQFFAEFIPSGRHEISYGLKVAQQGSFHNGPATLQCMYRPDVSVMSNSFRINTMK